MPSSHCWLFITFLKGLNTMKSDGEIRVEHVMGSAATYKQVMSCDIAGDHSK